MQLKTALGQKQMQMWMFGAIQVLGYKRQQFTNFLNKIAPSWKRKLTV